MRRFVLPLAAALALSACSSGASDSPAPAAVTDRIAAVSAAVDRWGQAETLAEAQAAAEEAANLVTGPDVPGYGDRDGNGTIEGAVTEGLLPGEQGEPGLTTEPGVAPLACLEQNVRGGSWADPQKRWEQLFTAIDGWSEANNTFPALQSHAQRVVGWATLTLRGDDLNTAIEFAGHAKLHSEVLAQDVADC